jgi:hypothetical protein
MSNEEKMGLAVVGISILMLVYVLITLCFLHVNPTTLKPFFKVGHCYQFRNNDPFRDHEIRIKVVEIKGGYMQYCFYNYQDGGWSTSTSAPITLMTYIYKEIPCETCRLKK